MGGSQKPKWPKKSHWVVEKPSHMGLMKACVPGSLLTSAKRIYLLLLEIEPKTSKSSHAITTKLQDVDRYVIIKIIY
jgi:hypothetical protein